jgi:hypothetical protein
MRSIGAAMTSKCRYQSTQDGSWYLTVFAGSGNSGILTQHLGGESPAEQPTWLEPILTVGAAADAFLHPAHPPPYRVLWFFVDSDYNLLRFGHD